MEDKKFTWFSSSLAKELNLTIEDDMAISEIVLGIDKEELGSSYDIAFCKAVLYGLTDIAEIMLANGANPNFETSTGSRPLNAAVQGSKVELVDMLLSAGADPDSVGEREWAPLGQAVNFGKNDIIELLLQRGASPNTKDKIIKSVHQTAFGIYRASPLHWCITDINDRARPNASHKILLKYGADLEATDSRKFTPLIFTADRNAHWIVDDLIQAGVNLDAINNKKNTAAHVAAEHDHSKILEPLLRAGASLTLENKEGLTPIGTAAANDSVKCLQKIQEISPGSLLAPDSRGNTSIHVAASVHRDEALEFLAEYTDNIDVENKEGMTPLMLASTNKYQSTIHLLVEQGADIEKTNHAGQSALDLAKEFSGGVVFKALKGYLK